MILVTGIFDSGVRIGVVEDKSVRLIDVPYFDIPSERYLMQIEKSVGDVGGWEKIDGWRTSTEGESFTSLRGLVTLVNALSALHDVSVSVLVGDSAEVTMGDMPLSPSYSSEPNISKRK
ncbi:hypothetical protein HOI83_00085 [Candidatus Uhrbacteria bacterium]|jgi:hypothetical protein|nr:hypothetical protein [Candidatus Uhrbacteria bacterium]